MERRFRKMERLLVAKAVVGSPVTMGYPIRRVRVPSLSAILLDNHRAGDSISNNSDHRQLRSST